NPSSILGIEEQYCHLWEKDTLTTKKEKQAPSLGCNTASTPHSQQVTDLRLGASTERLSRDGGGLVQSGSRPPAHEPSGQARVCGQTHVGVSCRGAPCALGPLPGLLGRALVTTGPCRAQA
ncbi:Disabled-like 2, partial [Manis pentadactyla]